MSKLIGYELLKDAPNLKAGTIGKIIYNEFDNSYCFRSDDKNIIIFDTKDIKRAGEEWFKPIYNETQEEIAMEIVQNVLQDKRENINPNKTLKEVLSRYEIKRK